MFFLKVGFFSIQEVTTCGNRHHKILLYECHINVEICSSIAAVKYLLKNVYHDLHCEIDHVGRGPGENPLKVTGRRVIFGFLSYFDTRNIPFTYIESLQHFKSGLRLIEEAIENYFLLIGYKIIIIQFNYITILSLQKIRQ